METKDNKLVSHTARLLELMEARREEEKRRLELGSHTLDYIVEPNGADGSLSIYRISHNGPIKR